MLKKLLATTVTMTLILSVVGIAFAEFDHSVFENYEEYKFEVEFDPMDDTGTISYPSNFEPFKSLSGSNDLLMVVSDIRSTESIGAFIRVQLIIKGTQTNAKRIILLPDKTRYTIDVVQSVDKALDIEAATFIITPSLMPMFKEIVNKEISSVKIRIDGDKKIDGFMEIDTGKLKILLDLYDAAGGVEQLLPQIDTMYPTTVK